MLAASADITGAQREPAPSCTRTRRGILAVLESLFVCLIPLETAVEAGAASWVPLPPVTDVGQSTQIHAHTHRHNFHA